MKTLETTIDIAASPQTVWAILDDLDRYPEWNKLVPELAGLTTVGQQVKGTLKQPNIPDIDLAPTITRIIGARELRWLTDVPNGVFRAEHIFSLVPKRSGATHLIHNEEFAGAAVADMWEATNVHGRAAYIAMNQALRDRAEAYARQRPAIHPAVDGGVSRRGGDASLTLTCNCTADPVTVNVSTPLAHNHLCGCSKCWKPSGALFAQIAVVADTAASVVSGESKLHIVDATQSIRRHACRTCGVHMVGRVEDPKHHFYGLAFVHAERAKGATLPAPEFAAFTSSLIETGTDPALMFGIRSRLSELGIPAYDAFSPELMDLIAWHRVKVGRFG